MSSRQSGLQRSCRRASRICRALLEALEPRRLLSTGLPVLNTFPQAHTAIYMDFTGDAGNVSAYDEDGDPTTFNAAEQANITEAVRQVAAYFAPFDVTVTTVKPTIPFAWVMISNSVSNGFTAIGSFPNTAPQSFVESWFADSRASAIAHEIGHNFGLFHQSDFNALGVKVNEYSFGYDATHTPIMGTPDATPIAKWFIGHSASGSTLQDDVAVIAAKIKAKEPAGGDGFRPDDFGNTIAAATPLIGDPSLRSISGNIERMSDVDAFSFTSDGSPVVVDVNPAAPSGLAPRWEVRAADGTLVAALDDTDRRNGVDNDEQAAIALRGAGTYYLLVASHGDYGDLGLYTASVRPATFEEALALQNPGPTGAVTPPLGLVAVLAGSSGSGVNLTWADVTGETGFVVDRSIDGAHWTPVATTLPGVTAYTDAGLFGSMRYWYRVRALDAGGLTSPPSGAVSVVNRPSAPFNLSVMSLTTSSVAVDWRDVSGETGYRVEKSLDGVTFTTVASVGANVTSATVTGLAVATKYFFRVTALSGVGDSASAVVTGSSRLASPALTFTGLAYDHVNLQWTTVAGATGYRVERSTDDTNFSAMVTLGNVTAFNDASVQAMGEYYYRVVALNALTESGVPSTVIYCGVPPVPLQAALPEGWSNADIGTPGGRGATSYDGRTYTVESGGTFGRYVYTSMAGDGQITARVTSVHSFAGGSNLGAGVMMRDSPTSTGAHYAEIALGLSSAAFLSSTTDSGIAGPFAPYWVRLIRTDSTFTGYVSADGVNWKKVGSAVLPMPSTIYVGLVASSENASLMGLSTLDHLTIDYPAITIASPVTATVSGATASFSALGGGGKGAANLIYTWSATSAPAGATLPDFQVNGNNVAKNTTARFFAAGDYALTVTVSDGVDAPVTSSVAVTIQPQPPAIVGRYIFDNASAYDGNDPAANALDDNAIDWNHSVLQPGHGSVHQNVTDAFAGITGLMIDVMNLPKDAGDVNAADVEVAAGTDPDPANWAAAQMPAVTVRRGAGFGGSDRIELTWSPGSIVNTWLRVTLLAGPRTGIGADDVFYLGNLAADVNGNGVITGADVSAVKAAVSMPASASTAEDVNHNGVITGADVTLVQLAVGGATLPTFTAPDTTAPVAAPAAAMMLAPATTTSGSVAVRQSPAPLLPVPPLIRWPSAPQKRSWLES